MSNSEITHSLARDYMKQAGETQLRFVTVNGVFHVDTLSWKKDLSLTLFSSMFSTVGSNVPTVTLTWEQWDDFVEAVNKMRPSPESTT